jgi:hypothetical protein
MIIDYPVNLKVQLKPIWHITPPEINIGVNNNIKKLILSEEQTFHYECIANDSSTLTIELLNKTDADSIPDKGLDKAVIIESISFFDITDPRFVWMGIYEPKYPEPWATQQQAQGVVLKQHLTNQTYMAWNGKWVLTFTVPVFTWIHHAQNLGWIYD